MKPDSYHNLIKDTLENTLIHLYMEVGKIKTSTGRKHVPTPVRNKIIADYIKPKLKDRRYAIIKKDLKTITLMKDRFGAIENHLVSIIGEDKKSSDLDKLYMLMTNFEKAGFSSELVDEKPEQRNDTIYLAREHILNCFDDSGMQIAPVSLFICSPDMTAFLDCLQSQSDFCAKLFESNEKLHSYHYQLHPYK